MWVCQYRCCSESQFDGVKGIFRVIGPDELAARLTELMQRSGNLGKVSYEQPIVRTETKKLRTCLALLEIGHSLTAMILSGRPRKLRTCLALLEIGHSLTAMILSGSVLTPSTETMWPRNFARRWNKMDLDGLSFRFAPDNRWKTSSSLTILSSKVAPGTIQTRVFVIHGLGWRQSNSLMTYMLTINFWSLQCTSITRMCNRIILVSLVLNVTALDATWLEE